MAWSPLLTKWLAKASTLHTIQVLKMRENKANKHYICTFFLLFHVAFPIMYNHIMWVQSDIYCCQGCTVKVKLQWHSITPAQRVPPSPSMFLWLTNTLPKPTHAQILCFPHSFTQGSWVESLCQINCDSLALTHHIHPAILYHSYQVSFIHYEESMPDITALYAPKLSNVWRCAKKGRIVRKL